MRQFVILAAPRTGSNMLCTLLNSHPAITCHHEIFNPRGVFLALTHRTQPHVLPSCEERDRDPLSFLKRFWTTMTGPDALGFKWTKGQNQQVLDCLVTDRQVLKIVLRRRNRVKTFVSAEIALRTDQWEVYEADELAVPRPQINIDGTKLRRHVAEYEQFYTDLTDELVRSDQNWICLYYEELFVSNAHRGLLEFLQVEPSDYVLQPASVKQNSCNLKESVANFSELATALAGTEFAEELHDSET
jgi:LPS sulfotransferase NodH